MLAFPFPPAPALDIEPEYVFLQSHEPICEVRFPYGESAWLVTRHADARTVLVRPRFSRAESLRRDVPRVTEVNFAGGIVAMDPPEHTRLRATCRHAFTKRAVDRLREHAVSLARELADAVVRAGRFRRRRGSRRPVHAADDLRAARRALRRQRAVPRLGGGRSRHDRHHRGRADRRHSRRCGTTSPTSSPGAGGRPSPTSISAMLAAQERWRAGRGTRHHRDDGARRGLRDHVHAAAQLPVSAAVPAGPVGALVVRPGLVGTAVEELLRFAPLEANGASPRYATVDVVLSGTRIPAGAPVVAATVVANRDPRVFAEPDTTRPDPRPQPAPRVRPRRAFLSRRAARPARTAGRARRARRDDARTSAGRRGPKLADRVVGTGSGDAAVGRREGS